MKKVCINLPDTGEEPAEQEGAVSLDEGGEEGEDAVDGQRDEKGLAAAYPVGQRPPEERPHHHPEVYNQTCGGRRKIPCVVLKWFPDKCKKKKNCAPTLLFTVFWFLGDSLKLRPKELDARFNTHFPNDFVPICC